MYTLNDIETRLRLDREKLVALGLLLGCDFVPKGVPGVGQARAVRLMEEFAGGGVLDRYEEVLCTLVILLCRAFLCYAHNTL